MNFRSPVALAAAVFLIACSGAEPEPEIGRTEQGAALLAPFKANLKDKLVTSMQSGVDEAIAVCSTAAPAIAESLSVDGVVMGRSSHKLRSPMNAAPDWVEPAIEGYLAGNSEPVAVELDGGRHGYVEPIKTQPLCLTCHGQALQPDVAEKLAELYPEDQATGFADGDFRGVFWVEY